MTSYSEGYYYYYSIVSNDVQVLNYHYLPFKTYHPPQGKFH